MEYKDLVFEEGKNYRLQIRRTTVDFIHVFDHFFEVLKYKGKTRESEGPWTILSDLHSMIRTHAGYPENNEEMTIILIDKKSIIYPKDKIGPVKEKKQVKSREKKQVKSRKKNQVKNGEDTANTSNTSKEKI